VERERQRAAAWLFTAAAGVYVLDRLTKLWAERALSSPIDIVPGAITLRLTTNSGGAFSIGRSAPWFFATVTILVSAAIVVTAFRHRDVLAGVAFGLVLGGALGNLTDRAIRGPGFRGRVVDFVDLHVWPVFNAADAAIVVGAVLLAMTSFHGGNRPAGSGDA
jgi:signal peptidase II